MNDILPAALQGPSLVFNTPRSAITEFDTTKRRTFNVDYNHAFNAGGYHALKGGYGLQRTINDINTFYPGGYVNIFWGRTFAFGGQTLGTGQYGYYEVNDRRIENHGRQQHPFAVRAGSVDGRQPPDAQPGRASRGREGADLPARTTSRTRSTSRSPTSWRRGWAPPTTCGPMAG